MLPVSDSRMMKSSGTPDGRVPDVHRKARDKRKSVSCANCRICSGPFGASVSSGNDKPNRVVDPNLGLQMSPERAGQGVKTRRGRAG